MQWRTKARLSAALWLFAATAWANHAPGAASDPVSASSDEATVRHAATIAQRYLDQFVTHTTKIAHPNMAPAA